MTGTQALGNGDTGAPKQKDELDQLFEIIESSDANEILQKVNAGVGNYDDELVWSQTESYRKGLEAHTLVAGLLIQRAIHDAKKWLAENGTAFYNEDEMDVRTYKPFDKAVNAGDVTWDERESSWTAKRRYGEEIWRSFDQAEESITKEQRAAMVKATGMEPGEWIPMNWDMFAGKHEISRGRAAELLKLYLGDHHTFEGDGEDVEQAKSGILRRRG